MSSSHTDAAIVDVVMPQMGTSVAEGTVVAWSVDVGASVKADQVVCEISTDKIDSDVPAPASGTLAEIVVPVGETVDVGAVIGRIATTDDAAPAPVRGPRYSPVVRRVAAHHDVDLSQLAGTGRGGRVTKQDVLAYVAAGGAEDRPLHTESPYRPDPVQAPSTRVDDLGGVAAPLSRMRQSIGAAMPRWTRA